jgi:hypothetical protein
MSVIQEGIRRRTVIEAYAKYDCSKKHRPLPDFENWDWSSADVLDSELCCAGLKCGVLTAFLLWDKLELNLSDLRDCAVEVHIFPEQSRKLGLVEGAGCLLNWKPNRDTSWYPRICRGEALDETEPLILRQALPSESPARFYVEDGSGRAIALLQNHERFAPAQVLAIAFLGRERDRSSTFGRRKLWSMQPANRGPRRTRL